MKGERAVVRESRKNGILAGFFYMDGCVHRVLQPRVCVSSMGPETLLCPVSQREGSSPLLKTNKAEFSLIVQWLKANEGDMGSIPGWGN